MLKLYLDTSLDIHVCVLSVWASPTHIFFDISISLFPVHPFLFFCWSALFVSYCLTLKLEYVPSSAPSKSGSTQPLCTHHKTLKCTYAGNKAHISCYLAHWYSWGNVRNVRTNTHWMFVWFCSKSDIYQAHTDTHLCVPMKCRRKVIKQGSGCSLSRALHCWAKLTSAHPAKYTHTQRRTHTFCAFMLRQRQMHISICWMSCVH